MNRKHFHFCRGEQERGQATEKLGGRIAGLHPQASCRVPSMAPGHPTGYDGVEGLGVASHPCSDAGKVARGGPQHSNMFSFTREGERATIHSDGGDLLPVGHRNITFGGKS